MRSTIVTTIIMLLAMIVGFFLLTDYGVLLVTEIAILAIFAMSLGLIMGYAGIISLGHAAFFGIGAYSIALFSNYVSNTYLLISIATIICAIIALVTGAIFIRTSHFYFLMITLAFGQMIYALFFQSSWAGASNGLAVSSGFDLGFGEIFSSIGFYSTMVTAFILIYTFLRLFIASPAGKITKGIMENEMRMKSLGYNTRVYKLLAYTISGSVAGIAGALYAFFNLFVAPDLTNWMFSGQALIMVIIGGVGTLFGPALGAAIYILLQNVISVYTDRWVLILGLILILLVLLGRGGVVHWFLSLWNYLKSKISSNHSSNKERKEVLYEQEAKRRESS